MAVCVVCRTPLTRNLIVVNGAIDARGAVVGDPYTSGAGGSIYLRAATLAGTGTLNASARDSGTWAAGSGGRFQPLFVHVRSEGDDLGRRRLAVNPLGHGHPVIVRQPEIQQDNIGLGLAHFLEDLGAVGRSSDDLETGLGTDDDREPFAQDLAIIDQYQ